MEGFRVFIKAMWSTFLLFAIVIASVSCIPAYFGIPTSAASSTPEPGFLNSIDTSNFDHTIEKQFRIEEIKRGILNRLGMTRVPDVSGVNMTIQERRQILRLYKKSMEDLGKKESSLLFNDDDKFYVNQFHSFTENGEKPEAVPDRLWSSPNRTFIYFSVNISEPDDPRKETIVKSATLKLYKHQLRPQNLALVDMLQKAVSIEIYQILQVEGDQLVRQSVSSRLVSLDKASWDEFDISRAVQDWIRDPAMNLGLEIVCDARYRMENLLEFISWSPAVADDPQQSTLLPDLDVLTHEKRILGRQKRNAQPDDCVVGSAERRCCRYPLTINFRDMRWDSWIFQPKSFHVYYCRGTCPAGHQSEHRHSNASSESGIQLSHQRIEGNSTTIPPRPACVSERMGNIAITHYNSNGDLIVSIFKNMYPESCWCA